MHKKGNFLVKFQEVLTTLWFETIPPTANQNWQTWSRERKMKEQKIFEMEVVGIVPEKNVKSLE